VKFDSFGRRAFLALSKVVELFRDKSCNIEYAAISCFTQIVRSLGDFLVSPLITPILRRLRGPPAVEYISCLGRLLRCLSFEFIKHTISLMLLEFTKTVTTPSTTGEILLILPFTVLDLSNADFLSLLTSPVIVMHYLSRVIFLTAHRFGSN
jgi:hypothetical protein